MRYYLAVDGGGTKTDFLARAADGSHEHRVCVGPTSVKSVGALAAGQNLRRGLRGILGQTGGTLADVICTAFGMSGLDSAQDERDIVEIVERLGWQRGRYLLVNDGVLAFYAASEPPGMVLIAGTGSIVVGVDADGRITRTGGWGYSFSDLGSGQWLGSEALKYTVLHCDGCHPYVPWFSEVLGQLGAQTFGELPEIVTTITEQDRIAALAPVLLDHPGEPLRDGIVAAGAAYLGCMLAANYQKMRHEAGERFTVVLAGGCLRDARYAAAVQAGLPPMLRQRVLPYTGGVPPVEGGIALAKKWITERGQPGATDHTA